MAEIYGMNVGKYFVRPMGRSGFKRTEDRCDFGPLNKPAWNPLWTTRVLAGTQVSGVIIVTSLP